MTFYIFFAVFVYIHSDLYNFIMQEKEGSFRITIEAITQSINKEELVCH